MENKKSLLFCNHAAKAVFYLIICPLKKKLKRNHTTNPIKDRKTIIKQKNDYL